ncbi:MAG: cytochrome c family protein [Alphaproteobacteria bacterium]|nr:cytochrome c family protein [Alphaproteobacteria bacterium]
MFDTMTITKVGGALAGALLIFLLLNWASDLIYSTGSEHAAEVAYLIEVEGDAPADEATPAETVDVAAMVAAGDVTKGQKVFGKCKACHKIGAGQNAAGPSLFAIVGKDVASADGFGYSSALSAVDGNWTVEKLNEFLTKPKAMVPGTKMGFAGLKKDADRANLIAYLQTLGN